MPKLIDLTGKRFGRLVVIQRGENNKHNRPQWLCECDCGNTVTVLGTYLKNGDTRSCGCFHSEQLADRNKTLGVSQERLWNIWYKMHARCSNEKNNAYKYYGAKGISVCKEWSDYFAFKDWALHNGYSAELTIDRKNVNGNYEPSNCRWVSRKVQMNNTSFNFYVNYQGERRSLSEWADILNFDRNLVYTRVKKLGWSFERAISEPNHNKKK